jgi:hypothetical protein
MIRVKNFTWNMEVFNSDYGSYNLNCGSKYTAGTKNFKTKGFTWASEVKLFPVLSQFSHKQGHPHSLMQIFIESAQYVK